VYRSLSVEEQIDAICANLSSRTGFNSLGTQIFGGAFSIGFENAGIEVAGHLEHKSADLGFFPSTQRWPVAVVETQDWNDIAKRIVREGIKPSVCHANTPCVAYAGTGNHEGTKADAMCYLRWFIHKVAMVIQPDVWTWELVPGVWGKDRKWIESIAYRASLKGYKCYAFLTSSAMHGGHQHRKRFHFVASKFDLDFDGVYDREPTYRKCWHPIDNALNQVEAARLSRMSDEDRLEYTGPAPLGLLKNDTVLTTGSYYGIFPYVPPGSHVRDLPDAVMYEHYRPNGKKWTGRGLPGFAHTRARFGHVSPNVMGGPTIVHPEYDRYLTPREKATIMGFPIDYEFTDSRGTAYAEIGKGLAVQTAEFLGRVIRDGLERSVSVSVSKGADIEVFDWRNGKDKKLKVGKLVMSTKDQIQWYVDRFGTNPPEGFGEKRKVV